MHVGIQQFNLSHLPFYSYRLAMPLNLEKIAATGYDGIDISGTHGPSVDDARVARADAEHGRAASPSKPSSPMRISPTRSLPTRRSTSRDRSKPLVVFHMILPSALKLGGGWSPISKTRLPKPRNVQLAVDGVWAGWLTDTPERFLELHDEQHVLWVNHPCYLTLLGF